MDETAILESERQKAGEDQSLVQTVEFKPKRLEFSKIIAIIAIVMWIIVNTFSMVMIAITLDISGLMYIVGSVDAVIAIVYTTYSLKAKAENMIKLKKVYGYDAESVVDAVLRSEQYCESD